MYRVFLRLILGEKEKRHPLIYWSVGSTHICLAIRPCQDLIVLFVQWVSWSATISWPSCIRLLNIWARLSGAFIPSTLIVVTSNGDAIILAKKISPFEFDEYKIKSIHNNFYTGWPSRILHFGILRLSWNSEVSNMHMRPGSIQSSSGWPPSTYPSVCWTRPSL